MNKKLKKSLRRGKGRLEVGKENIKLRTMDSNLRRVFPDRQKRLNYITSVIDLLGE